MSGLGAAGLAASALTTDLLAARAVSATGESAMATTAVGAAAEASVPGPEVLAASAVTGMSGWAPTVATLLLASALLLPDARPGRGRLRSLRTEPAASPPPPVRRGWAIVGGAAMAALAWVVIGGTAGLLAGLLLGAGSAGAMSRLLRNDRSRTSRPTENADLAGGWELMATCLEAGLPVAAAVDAAAARIEGEAALAMRRVAGLLQLGSAPDRAWATVSGTSGLASFARAAQRSADTGAGLARVARNESARLRAGLTDQAEARAERAAVLIAAPLGLCFLPAFLVLGIAPVIIGLTGEVLTRW